MTGSVSRSVLLQRPAIVPAVIGVAAAVLALSVGAAAGSPETAPSTPDALAGAVPDSTPGGPAWAVADSTAVRVPLADRAHVYYFHRTIRCENCLKFEAYAEEALRSSFTEELNEGRLVWSVLNLDDESSKALVDSYDVFESSLVVSEVSAGKQAGWKKLEAIWSLVSDKPAFLTYVAAEVDSALAVVKGGDPEPPMENGDAD